MKSNYSLITTTKLAKICGVSQGTVDRAINNRPGISNATKEKVLKAAKEYGYLPNIHAKVLSGGKSMMLGIIVFNLYNEYFSKVIMELEQVCKDNGYSTVVMFSNYNMQTEIDCINQLVHIGVDGIVLCPSAFSDDYCQYLKSLKTPVVTIGNKIDGILFSGIDDFSAMQKVTQYVYTSGYHNLVMYAPPLKKESMENVYAQWQRVIGFETTAKELNADYLIIKDNNDVQSYIASVQRRKVGIICTSDLFAIKLLSNIKSFENIGIIGFDNISVLDECDIDLDSVQYDNKEIAINAFDAVINHLPIKKYAGYTLIKRNSIHKD